jgi:hypothetical protein
VQVLDQITCQQCTRGLWLGRCAVLGDGLHRNREGPRWLVT